MSFYLAYRAVRGTMLGGVRESKSCRYETPELALIRGLSLLDAHKGTSADGLIRIRLLESNRKPEITLQDSGPEVRRYIESDQFKVAAKAMRESCFE